MVVNIVISGSRFIGIDGNGIKVLQGGFTYDYGEEIWEGYCVMGRTNLAIQKKVNSEEYFCMECILCDNFIKEMLGEAKGVIVNKVINF